MVDPMHQFFNSILFGRRVHENNPVSPTAIERWPTIVEHILADNFDSVLRSTHKSLNFLNKCKARENDSDTWASSCT